MTGQSSDAAREHLPSDEAFCDQCETYGHLTEADDLLLRFMDELAKPTGDGQQKRKKGKPPWYVDTDHHRAMFSHYHKWLAGEKVDPDSGAHPLVHLAWRALGIACQETGNVPTVLTAAQQVL